MIRLNLCFVGMFLIGIINGLPEGNYPQIEKVVGGSDVSSSEQFPYMVSLRIKNEHICGGSILNENWILTAAHCVDGVKLEDFSVVTGTIFLDHGGNNHRVDSYTRHPDYDRFDITDDLALIHLSKPLIFTKNVQPVELTNNEGSFTGPGNVPCILTGWGKTNYSNRKLNQEKELRHKISSSLTENNEEQIFPNNLQFIHLKTVLHTECKRLLPEFPVRDSQICTLMEAGLGACRGDSGGPLVMITNKDNQARSKDRVFVQIGVVSYGRPCAKGYPDVYTRVEAYLGWIESVMLQGCHD